MVLFDVNVLLYAFIPQSDHHQQCRKIVGDVLAGEEAFGLSELVLAAVVRIATNKKVFKPPAPIEKALAFANTLRLHPRAKRLEAGERHWLIFEDLLKASGITGSDTTDAYLAALALEHNCTWVTTDKDFKKFPGLKLRYLLS